jgi:hypothetical protein
MRRHIYGIKLDKEQHVGNSELRGIFVIVSVFASLPVAVLGVRAVEAVLSDRPLQTMFDAKGVSTTGLNSQSEHSPRP